MANKGLIVIGIFIIVGIFYLTNIYITPQQIQQLEFASYLCNAEIMGIPIGNIGRAISSDAAEICDKIEMILPIIKYRLYLYGLGFLLIILGIAIGGKKQVIREIVHETHAKEEHEEEAVKETPKITSKLTSKFCRKCGNKLNKDAKFCNKCGNKI